MAFNYRASNSKEIIQKKKTYSPQAAMIFDHIKKNYDEIIILDPTTTFNKIKVPRAVKESINITNLKKELTSSGIDIKGITIDFGNGSGGSGGTDAVETAKQENATRLYCEFYIEKNKFPTMKQLKEVYENADEDWVMTFEAQAKLMKSYLKGKGYEWSRDEGIMPFVESVAKNKCGVATKDSWNPADIYCVRKTKKAQVQKKITQIGNLKLEPRERLDALNDYMRDAFKKKDLIGISLKKLKKGKATSEETNVVKKGTIKDISIVKNSISLDLDLMKNGEFKNGEMSFKLDIKGTIVNVQIRAFSGGVRESTQMDMTGVGAAAKLGKVSSRESIDPFLSVHALSRRMGTDLPKVGEWSKSDIKKYVDEWNSIKSFKIGGQSINWGKNDWSKTLPNAIQLEKDIDRTASQLSSKLQCFQWVKIFNTIDKKKKLPEFLTTLYYGAKKEYSSAGPFLKIS